MIRPDAPHAAPAAFRPAATVLLAAWLLTGAEPAAAQAADASVGGIAGAPSAEELNAPVALVADGRRRR